MPVCARFRLMATLYLCIWCAHGEIYTYNNEKVDAGSLVDFGLSIVAPGPGHNSSVLMNLEFARQGSSRGDVSVALVGIKPRDLPKVQQGIGKTINNERHVCCDLEVQTNLNCRLNDLLFDEQLIDVYHSGVLTNSMKPILNFELNENISDTRFCMIIVGLCDQKQFTGDPVVMTGTVQVVHPYGQLNAIEYPYLPFYSYMCLAYFTLGCVWLALNALHYSEVMQVQQCISSVVALCMIEMISWFYFYETFNKYGTRQLAPLVLSLVTSSVRRTVSRMLVVAVSLGFGVSKPALGSQTRKVLLVGFVYLLLESMLQLNIHLYPGKNGQPTDSTLLLMIPVSILDGYFYWWIFTSLSSTLDDLQQRRQTAKYNVMKWFTGILVASLVMACLFGMFRIYFVESAMQFGNWQWTFMFFNGFAQLLYLAILIAIVVLWRPSANSRNIAYAEQIGDIDLDEDFALTLHEQNVDNHKILRRVSNDFVIEDDSDFDEEDTALET